MLYFTLTLFRYVKIERCYVSGTHCTFSCSTLMVSTESRERLRRLTDVIELFDESETRRFPDVVTAD